MARSYTNLLYHVVFGTKDRYPWLEPTVAGRVYEYVGGVVRGSGGIALAVGGMPDHVHLLVKYSQDRTVADAVRAIKANSSAWIHDTLPGLQKFA